MNRSRATRGGLAAMAVAAGVLGGMLAGANPASADAGRSHPQGTGPGGELVTDTRVTLVRYYNGTEYNYCLNDVHSPITSVTEWSGSVTWTDSPTQSIPRQSTLWCSGYQRGHGHESVSYVFGSVHYTGVLP